jgi:hypothetical protein
MDDSGLMVMVDEMVSALCIQVISGSIFDSVSHNYMISMVLEVVS